MAPVILAEEILEDFRAGSLPFNTARHLLQRLAQRHPGARTFLLEQKVLVREKRQQKDARRVDRECLREIEHVSLQLARLQIGRARNMHLTGSYSVRQIAAQYRVALKASAKTEWKPSGSEDLDTVVELALALTPSHGLTPVSIETLFREIRETLQQRARSAEDCAYIGAFLLHVAVQSGIRERTLILETASGAIDANLNLACPPQVLYHLIRDVLMTPLDPADRQPLLERLVQKAAKLPLESERQLFNEVLDMFRSREHRSPFGSAPLLPAAKDPVPALTDVIALLDRADFDRNQIAELLAKAGLFRQERNQVLAASGKNVIAFPGSGAGAKKN